MVSPASIVTSPAFGLPVLVGYVNPASIVTTTAFGFPVIAGRASLTSIVTSTVFGRPVALAATTRPITVFIGGADRTRYIKDPSIVLTAQIGATISASFSVLPKDGVNYAPALHDEVVIYHNPSGHRVFGGEIGSTARTNYTGTSGQYEIVVNCTGYGVMLERRTVAKFYTEFLGNQMAIITLDLANTFLTGTGITYDFTNDYVSGQALGEQLFNWVTVREAMDQMAAKAQLDYCVTNYKQIKLFSRAAGHSAAPITIVEGNRQWISMTATRTVGKFWNRAIARNSQDVIALWTDTVTGDGTWVYPTTYPQHVKPVIRVNGVDQIVCEINDRGSTVGWQWYYIVDSPGIFANTGLAAPTVASTITVIHPSKVSSVWIAEDLASIAAVGTYEHIEEVKDVTNNDAGAAAAAGILAQGVTVATNLNIETDQPGCEPGQVLTVSTTDVSGSFVIDNVSMREVAKGYPRWTVQASNSSVRNGTASTFFQKMISNSRQPVDRIDYGISFNLAETVPGYTNPGLTTGLKTAFATARKDGRLKYCRLHFGSVDAGTLTTALIEIDVLKNGVSIFGTVKMRFPAGATILQETFAFASSPLLISAGDRFTLNVISADPLAKDGFLELQVAG